MTSPNWYYRETIEHELERLGATTWRYMDDPGGYRDEQQAAPAQVELSSEIYGAVLGQPEDFLRTLGHLQDNSGDDRIAEAIRGPQPGPQPGNQP
jgi:hypothetical protein